MMNCGLNCIAAGRVEMSRKEWILSIKKTEQVFSDIQIYQKLKAYIIQSLLLLHSGYAVEIIMYHNQN
jgi:hypothetical protein